MTAIAATSLAVTPSNSTLPAAAMGSTGTPSPPSAAPQSPAVVISLSPGTLSAVSHPADKTAEQRVNSLVEAVKTHNGIADLHAHVAWEAYAQDVGAEKANAAKNASLKYLDYSAARIGREFGESGIGIRPATDKQVAESGLAAGTLLVKDFSFKSGGSTYAVTAREDGTLVGTRDGQAWKTWKTIPSSPAPGGNGATAALATLQGPLSPAKPGTATRLVQLTA